MVILAILVLKLFLPSNPVITKEKDVSFEDKILTDWKQVKEKNDIALFERWVYVNENLKVKERKGELIVDCRITEVASYLGQVQTIPEWLNNVSLATNINSKPCDEQLIRLVFKLPWPFDNRELTGQFNTFIVDDTHRIVKITSINNSEDFEEKPDIKRIKNFRATWQLEKLIGNKTKIVFITFSEEPPLFPLWLQDPVVKNVFLNNLRRLKIRLSEIG